MKFDFQRTYINLTPGTSHTSLAAPQQLLNGALRVATRRVERSLGPVGPEAHREDLVERGGIAGRGRGRRRR